MDARWSVIVVATVVLAVALLLVVRRGAAQPASSPPPPPPPEAPKVLPGDHSATPLFPALDPGQKLWGFIDTTGRFVIAPQYSSAEPFSEGLAFIVAAGGHSLECIDKNNRRAFTLKNPSPTGWLAVEGGFHEGFALVVLQASGTANRYTFVDRAGVLLGPPRFWPARAFSGGVAAVAKDGRWGFLGPDGELAIPLRYSEVFDFTDGLAAFVRKERMGYIDRHAKEVIPARYELALEFGEGLAPVQPGSPARGETTEMGFIDRTGKLVIKPRFYGARPFREGRARVDTTVGNPQKWGFIDTAGKLVVPAEYADVADFSEGLAAVKVGQAWGYVDRDGRQVIAPAFLWAGPFTSGLARVTQRGGPVPMGMLREGYIDPKGAWVHVWDIREPHFGIPMPQPPR